ncbi:ras GTPase-activating protein-binding protein 2 [Diorhabda carinulata]|uniref:ras GTPase-activating protein-binding protein 2 n=1 Tax=Diorhabda carinulata TaxID=1163345 RepID=UPI0025A030E4|nr:ras GTPase-activating protein-binding protein 2 [Diorhabda carinulata]XP_057660664.1 ras GTPase-activating protein-binding protein 2 [Diorhabda carinulata]XP_057660665.1 ras GTPase-activating protein-binding protein 2 [Diorhabda carinulata]
MVMEAPPSPQSVGREFVRQYYTLLNKAPTHLHRFYNHQSSFIHGGLDPPNRESSPVIGQKQIHQKIQQLNFRDCHAKITQVDSQATLGNGVVVQVTGELSNAGQPMRRFTQTFVLAAQSPKKFYVHNDIFRYQDEIISDEECDDGVHSEPDEEVSTGQPIVEHQAAINQPAIAPYYNPNAAQLPAAIPAVPIHHNQQPPPPHVINPPVPPTVNGSIHPEEMNVMQGPVPSMVTVPQTQPIATQLPAMQQGIVQAPIIQQPPIEEPQPPMEELVEEPLDNSYSEPQENEQEQDVNVTESASNEPKTYANLLKSGSNSPYVSPPSQTATAQGSQSMVRPASPQANIGYQGTGSRTTNANSVNNRNNATSGNQRPNQPPQRMSNRQDSGRGNTVGGRSGNDDANFDDRRRSQSQNFNDVNQLFLGNLPHTATEEELREIFSEFGAILDLRVHSKPSKVGGAPGARAPPNYGFITYETQQGVENCLKAKPIYYSKEDKNSIILNVEEKKTKDRTSYGGGRPMDNRDQRSGRGDNSGQRRGMGGPGGPNRNSNSGVGGPQGPNNRTNTYNNRNSGGGPPNRGQNTYNRR